MSPITRLISIILITLATTYAGAADPIAQETKQNEFKIMSYNVLNLFDAKHDRGKLDHTWLPINYRGKTSNCQKLRSEYYRELCLKTDWTDAKVDLKIQQIKKVVESQGSLPDLLAVQEIENDKVTRRLANALGYENFVITKGPDKRGIEVALLFNEDKLTYVEHEEINVSDHIPYTTRNILRVIFHPKAGRAQDTIGVYVNHWPSQAAPPTNRFQVAEIFAKDIEEQTKRFGASNYFVIATGDFNTLDHESPNAFSHMITRPFWDYSLVDLQVQSERKGNPATYKMPPGTYWYHKKKKYNRLDRFFISRNLLNTQGIKALEKTFRIVGSKLNSRKANYGDERSKDFYATSQMVPTSYNFQTTKVSELGHSDHYPIVAKFKIYEE